MNFINGFFIEEKNLLQRHYIYVVSIIQKIDNLCIGVPISTPNPIIQKMNLIGEGTNADASHIPAAIENPMEYLVVS